MMTRIAAALAKARPALLLDVNNKEKEKEIPLRFCAGL
jgi:hypothetical protein